MNYKEWEIEPNNMSFTYAGMYCQIKRNDQFGFFNAYVFIPESNIYFGLDYDYLNSLFSKEIGMDISFGDYIGSRWAFGLSFSSIRDFIPNDVECPELDGLMNALKKMTGIKPTEKDYKNIEYVINKVQLFAELLSKKN